MVGGTTLKRGRPPHDDVLTPAEWRVLAYLQLGRTNEQIGEHLGVSINTVRYHVSNLLAKAGGESRRELLTWRPLGLTGARAEAPFFRGDRLAALRGLLPGGEGDIAVTASEIAQSLDSGTANPLFSGTVEEVASVIAFDGGTLSVALGSLAPELRADDWVALNGARLRVSAREAGQATFDVPADVARLTNVGALKPAAVVNLERSSRVTDRMTGHVVRGLVDGTATLRELEPEGDAVLAYYETPRELVRLIIEKGRVAVDGVSLTVIEITQAGFRVSLVPFTRSNTNLTQRRLGEQVNIETDVLARYVDELIAATIDTTPSEDETP